MLIIVAIGGAVIPPRYSRIATGWSFAVAWCFQGIVCLGFALIACLAPSRRNGQVSAAAGNATSILSGL